MLTRRLLLAGGPVTVLAVGGAYDQRNRLRRLVRGGPSSPHQVPAVATGPLVSGSFASTAMRTAVGWSLSYPRGFEQGSPLPLLLVLHGRGDDHRDAFAGHHLGRFLSATVAAGTPAFAVASVDGGDHTYWHARRSGQDPQAMIINELLPVLAGRGIRTDAFALGGWSMGGYGALLLAHRLGPERIRCVAVDSPALWSRWQDSAAGAFDGPADFAAYDVLAWKQPLAFPVRVSCGTSDPFLPGVQQLLRRSPAFVSDLGPGAHDVAWWEHAAPAQLAFVGRILTPPESAGARRSAGSNRATPSQLSGALGRETAGGNRSPSLEADAQQ